MDRDRDVNMPRTNVEAPRADVGTEPDLRRSMIMGRGLDTTANVRDVDLPFVRNEQISPMAGDEMRWGSIWGGFFAYFALTLVLGALAVAIGAAGAGPATPGAAPTIAPTTAGVVTGLVLLLATFIGALITGWTANLRSGWGSILNGFVLGALISSLPVLLAIFAVSIGSAVASGVAAGQAAVQPGTPQLNMPTGLGMDAATLQLLGANVGWFSLGVLLIHAVAVLGTWLGMRAHLNEVKRNPIAGGIAVSEYNRHLREDMLRREEHNRQEVGYGRDVNR
jgi:MFS family permease